MVTLDPEEQTVTQGEQFGLSATIENVGQVVADTQTVELRFDGELINDQEVVLDSGESRTLRVRGSKPTTSIPANTSTSFPPTTTPQRGY